MFAPLFHFKYFKYVKFLKIHQQNQNFINQFTAELYLGGLLSLENQNNAIKQYCYTMVATVFQWGLYTGQISASYALLKLSMNDASYHGIFSHFFKILTEYYFPKPRHRLTLGFLYGLKSARNTVSAFIPQHVTNTRFASLWRTVSEKINKSYTWCISGYIYYERARNNQVPTEKIAYDDVLIWYCSYANEDDNRLASIILSLDTCRWSGHHNYPLLAEQIFPKLKAPSMGVLIPDNALRMHQVFSIKTPRNEYTIELNSIQHLCPNHIDMPKFTQAFIQRGWGLTIGVPKQIAEIDNRTPSTGTSKKYTP